MKFDKLVRDRIPEIIEKNGSVAVTRTLTDEEYRVYLEKKLDEEVTEYHESKSIEELADILEVVNALCGCDLMALDQVRLRKFCERGGFEAKILLMETSDKEGQRKPAPSRQKSRAKVKQKKYIASETLIKKMFPYGMPNEGNYGINAKSVKLAIERCPAADVADQGDLKQIFDEIENAFARSGVLPDTFGLVDLAAFAELRKKYIKE